ncbi:hypothetical protein Cgig2_024257 [Carnegiea gigantea]|uniref:Proteasome activator subunit 4 n=1 Tax=Carnegiea gigantea TaxID=171969 RepID=A0A9Q1GR00_9CARY|nr:hypothetical protein Cgig2_024257 [Carnegiea gigantea]
MALKCFDVTGINFMEGEHNCLAFKLVVMISAYSFVTFQMTATHQLKTAVTSVAYTARSLLFTSLSSVEKSNDPDGLNSFIGLLVISLSNALLGMDANDPPKTLATMQLIGSMFSNIAALDDNTNNPLPISAIQFSEWLDEFLCRLFSLLLHLEPNSVTTEGLNSMATSGTFLVEDGPHYFCMLEILLGRLSKSLFSQALKKISKFVRTNILPGAVAEVGLLCCACMHSNPKEAIAHLVEPLLSSVISSMKGTPSAGFVGVVNSSLVGKAKPALSPALETAIDYQLKVLSVCISYGGPHLLCYRDQFKEAINLAFESPSWKVNGAGDHVLRSLLGSLVLYYPVDQYRCVLHDPSVSVMEKWISTKDYTEDGPLLSPKWHVPVEEEISFANELLSLHFQSALDLLLKICQDKIHTDAGTEKDHLKVTLLRIDSSLQGILSCLPDFRPSFCNGNAEDLVHSSFLLAGDVGVRVGCTEMRERAAEIVHAACRYLLEEKSDDSILLVLSIRVIDALVNYGSLEYDEWANHRQAWRLESAAIVEPPINFITSSHSHSKRRQIIFLITYGPAFKHAVLPFQSRPRWALVDKAYMHNTWRASQSSFHLYRTRADVSPSSHAILLMDDLINLALHRYEAVRSLAGKSLLKMIKRWPSMVSKCLFNLTENLANPNAPEYAVLGSCTILSTQTVLKHLVTDANAFTSFVLAILKSSHHESLKAQKAITELFVKFNILFSGVPRSIFKISSSHEDGQNFPDLISQIVSMSFDTSGLHWRYNLMANRVLLLVVMASRNDPHSSTTILSETAGHFLKNLKSQLPQTRILAISALNTLLKESPHKMSAGTSLETVVGNAKSSVEGALVEILKEEGFFNQTFNSLSHVHIISDTENTSSRGSHGNSSFQSIADKSITFFYFDFSASWPRTPSWVSLLGSDTFYSNFARIFKRLIQECGIPVLQALKSALDEFASAKERAKQCVAAEAYAGVLHSDVSGLLDAWDDWMLAKLQDIIMTSSVESVPDWAACIRYAVTGKGKHGTRAPLLRQKVIECLLRPLPPMITTTVIAKRYAFLAAAFIEISPPRMPESELLLHRRLLKELLLNMSHVSAQVREAVGVLVCVLCSNIQLHRSFATCHSEQNVCSCEDEDLEDGSWNRLLLEQAAERSVRILNAIQSDNIEVQSNVARENGITNDSEEDVKWMETLFHFVIASLKSGRSLYVMDTIVGVLYPVMSLQDTSNKDLSTLAKAAFELLKWNVFGEPHLQNLVAVILKSANDSNWRTRSKTLTFLRTFMYRTGLSLFGERERGLAGSWVSQGLLEVIGGLPGCSTSVRLLQWTPACSAADGEASTDRLVAGDLLRRSGVASIATVESLCRSQWSLLVGGLSPLTFPVTGVSFFSSGRLKCSSARFVRFSFSVVAGRGFYLEGCKRFVAIESKSFDLTIVGTAEDVDRGKRRVITELGMRASRLVSTQVYSRCNSFGNRRNRLRDSNGCSSEGSVCTNWPPDALLVCDTSSPSTDEAKCVDSALYDAKIGGQAVSNIFVPLARDAVVSHQVHRGSLVREHAAAVLAGLMKGGDENLSGDFRDRAYKKANLIIKTRKRRTAGYSVASIHGAVLALVACVLSVPYDMPSWLPDHVTLLARFVAEPSPVRSTVTKAVAEFRRTHADTWSFQKEQFSEEQLEVLADTSSSSSYFA